MPTKKTEAKKFYKKPTLVLLPFKEEMRWYICFQRNTKRTAFEAHRKAEAALALAAFALQLKSPSSVNATPIADVVTWARTQPRYKNATYAGILPVWLGKRVSDLSQVSSDAAIAQRQTHLHPVSGEPITENAALTEARWLKAMCRSHARTHGLPDPASYTIRTTAPIQNERALTKAETARLLWACLGYRWDSVAQRMVPHGKRERKRLRRLRAPMRRLILLGLYAGTSIETGRALVWDGTPDRADSFIDVRGWRLNRLGKQAPRTANLKDMPVALGRRMMAHVRRWRAHDASSVKHIVHVTARGKYNRGLADNRFKEICQDAGVVGVPFSMVVTTFAAMSLREGATIRALAIALGLSADATNRRYRHFSVSFQKGAARAFRARPDSISGRDGSDAVAA